MSTSLPALVRERLVGALVHRAVPTYARGFSSLSTRYAVISDGPGFYVYDSGGLLGQAVVVGRDRDELQGRVELAWVAGSSVLLVQVWMDAERVVGLKLRGGDAVRVAEVLAPPGEGIDSRAPMAVELGFSLDREALITALVEDARGDEAQISVIRALSSGDPRPPEALLGGVMGRLRTLPDDRRALLEHLFCGELHARIQVEDEALVLSGGLRGGVATIPLSQLELSRVEGRTLVLTGTAIAAGFQVERLVLHCPERALAAALERALAAPPQLEVEALGGDRLVLLQGVGERAEPLVQARARLELSEEALELRALSGELVHRFSLEPGRTAIQGTPERLVLLDEEAGPLGVEVGSEAGRRALARHSRLAGLARRAASEGPFVARLEDGTPVAMEVHEGVIHWAGEPRSPLPVSALEGLDLQAPEEEEWPRLVLSTHDEQVVLVADHAMLEGMAAHLRAAHLTLAGVERVPALLRALSALERDWLLHQLAGPLVRVHLALGPTEAGPLEVPSGPGPQVGLLAAVLDAMAPLRRLLERRVLELPRALAREDRRLLAAAGRTGRRPPLSLPDLSLLTGQLDRLDRILHPARVLRPHLRSLGRPPRPLGAPPPLLTPLGEAAALQAARHLGAAGLPRVRQALEDWLPEWNHLLLGLLPPMILRVEEALPSGLDELLLGGEPEAAEALLPVLAHRFARVENALRFSAPEARSSRGEELGWLRRFMEEPSV